MAFRALMLFIPFLLMRFRVKIYLTVGSCQSCIYSLSRGHSSGCIHTLRVCSNSSKGESLCTLWFSFKRYSSSWHLFSFWKNNASIVSKFLLGFLEHECIIVTLKVLSRVRFFSQWSEQRTWRWKCTERDFKWITLNYLCLFLFKENKSYLV